jgi:3-hydroxyisobutyrate dehydrogenase-like beta-hydroxyacid dehydrogenase
MAIERICLLGLGEVGLALAEDLLGATSLTLSLWDSQFGSAGSKAERHWSILQTSARIVRARDAASAAIGCQLVLSAVTADEAVNAAESILPGLADQCWFVDLNSVSPGTKQRLGELIAGVGGRFVEASVMAPIFPKRIAAPILLAGPHAKAFEALGHELGFIDMRAVSAALGVAAATKMCRSVIIKGLEALVTESLLAARHYGVDAAVLASLTNLLPRDDWPEYAHYLITRSLQHGARRAAEMREVAKTVGEAGLTPWMSAACAERQDWAAQFEALLDENSLGELLDGINQHIQPTQKSH